MKNLVFMILLAGAAQFAFAGAALDSACKAQKKRTKIRLQENKVRKKNCKKWEKSERKSCKKRVKEDRKRLKEQAQILDVFSYVLDETGYFVAVFDCKSRSFKGSQTTFTDEGEVVKEVPVTFSYDSATSAVAIAKVDTLTGDEIKYVLSLPAGRTGLMSANLPDEFRLYGNQDYDENDRPFYLGVVADETPEEYFVKDYGQKVGFIKDRLNGIGGGKVFVNGVEYVDEFGDSEFDDMGAHLNLKELLYPSGVELNNENVLDAETTYGLQSDYQDLLKELAQSSK
jgi:hypothetical protein